MFALIAKAVHVFTKVYHWITTIGKVIHAVDAALRTLSSAYRMRRAIYMPPPKSSITQFDHQRRFYTVPPVDEDDLDDEDGL